MLPFELLSALFFAALAIAATALRHRPQARLALLLSVTLIVMIVVTSRTAPAALRAWAGHLYLVAAYRIPGLLAAATPGTWFEDWLVASDLGWRSYVTALPTWLSHVCELAYLLCYPLVPASFLFVWVGGDAAHVTRFWLAVLGAGFGCYGLLPWLVSRPPRLVAGETIRARGIARANVIVLDRLSHRLNTFPSGHVAVSVASAASVWPVSPAAGTAIGVLALGVAIGAVSGRYHYVIDVVAGAVVGLLSTVVVATVAR
jgi:membrane-associated phospholipid phosphatase